MNSASPVAIGDVREPDEIAVVRALFERYAAALPFDLAYQDFATELAGLPAPYVAPCGRLLLARDGSLAIGVVGLKPLASGTGEIKRLYVAPEARGRGVGEILLRRALEAAWQIGYARVRLDSHRPSMGPALGLYRRLGFVEIPPYGPDLGGAIVFFEKILG
jgi:ribosomal protein S18 acetylase RimI-like enzyme